MKRTGIRALALFTAACLAAPSGAEPSAVQDSNPALFDTGDCLDGAFAGVSMLARFSPASVKEILSERAAASIPVAFVEFTPLERSASGVKYRIVLDKTTSVPLWVEALVSLSDEARAAAYIKSIESTYLQKGLAPVRAAPLTFLDKKTKLRLQVETREQGVMVSCLTSLT